MAYGFGTDARDRRGLGRLPTIQSPRTPLFTGGQMYNPRNLGVPSILTRVAGAASLLPPLQAPFSAQDTAGGAPPPGYGDLLNSLLSGLAGAQGGMLPEEGVAAARRALIQYGGVPQGMNSLKQLGGAFDPATQKLAEANTRSGISLLARLNEAHADQNRYIVNRLAAHGLLDSGETGFQSGREQTNYARAQADAGAKLLDYLANINSGIAQYNQWKAMMDAIQSAMAYGGTASTTSASGGGGGGGADSQAAPLPVQGSYRAGVYRPFIQLPRGGRNVYL